MRRVINVLHPEEFNSVTGSNLSEVTETNILEQKYKSNPFVSRMLDLIPLVYDCSALRKFHKETGLKLRHEIFDRKLYHVFDRFGSYSKWEYEK